MEGCQHFGITTAQVRGVHNDDSFLAHYDIRHRAVVGLIRSIDDWRQLYLLEFFYFLLVALQLSRVFDAELITSSAALAELISHLVF